MKVVAGEALTVKAALKGKKGAALARFKKRSFEPGGRRITLKAPLGATGRVKVEVTLRDAAGNKVKVTRAARLPG